MEAGIGIGIGIMIFSFVYLAVNVKGDGIFLRLFFLMTSLILGVLEFGVLGELARENTGYESVAGLMNVGLRASWFIFFIVLIVSVVRYIWVLLEKAGKLPSEW